jgi:kynureninase
LDHLDELKTYRDAFIFPKPAPASPLNRTIYLCGNSLGLQPKSLKAAVTSQLDKWADEGVEGHFSGDLT